MATHELFDLKCEICNLYVIFNLQTSVNRFALLRFAVAIHSGCSFDLNARQSVTYLFFIVYSRRELYVNKYNNAFLELI